MPGPGFLRDSRFHPVVRVLFEQESPNITTLDGGARKIGHLGRRCRLLILFTLMGGFFFFEIIVGYLTNSMALVADSFHMLGNEATLIVAYVALKTAPKQWKKSTFGWARAEVLAALVNAIFLIALCFSITVKAFERFLEPEKIHQPLMLIIVGAVGFSVNIVGLFLFNGFRNYHTAFYFRKAAAADDYKSSHVSINQSILTERSTESELQSPVLIIIDENEILNIPEEAGHKGQETFNENENVTSIHSVDNEESYELSALSQQFPTFIPESFRRHHYPGYMHIHALFVHSLTAAVSSIMVMVLGVVYLLTVWKYNDYLDPALSIVIALLILYSIWPLLRDSALILLQTVPKHIKIDGIRHRLLERVEGVLGVHELHVWQLAGSRIIATAHIRCKNLEDYMIIAGNVKEFFHNEGIHSTTIQPEFDDAVLGSRCILVCPRDHHLCMGNTCCLQKRQENDGQCEDTDMCAENICCDHAETDQQPTRS